MGSARLPEVSGAVQGPSAADAPGVCLKHTRAEAKPFESGSGRAHAAACGQIPGFSSCPVFEDLGPRSLVGGEHRLGCPHRLSLSPGAWSAGSGGPLLPPSVTFLFLLVILKPGPQVRCDTGEALVCNRQRRRLISQGRGGGQGQSAPGKSTRVKSLVSALPAALGLPPFTRLPGLGCHTAGLALQGESPRGGRLSYDL